MTESEQKPLFFIDDVGDHTTNQLDISNCEPIVNENYFGSKDYIDFLYFNV